MNWGVTLEMYSSVSHQIMCVELGSTPIHGDVDLFNVDLCGRAMLSDHAIHDQHIRVELGSTPMRDKEEKPLQNWAGQFPVWLTCFWVGGLTATM